MLTTLVLTNDDDIVVGYKTDLPEGAITGNFTVMDTEGLSDAEKHLGLDFKQLTYNIEAFKTFALNNNLALIRVDNSGKEVIVNYTDESSSSVLW